MNIRDLKANLDGTVLETSTRSLTEREMASVSGGGPIIINPNDPDVGSTPTKCLIDGCCCLDDCQD